MTRDWARHSVASGESASMLLFSQPLERVEGQQLTSNNYIFTLLRFTLKLAQPNQVLYMLSRYLGSECECGHASFW